MKTLCIEPSTTKQLAILVLAWMNGRSSIETIANKMNLFNIAGQYIQNAFYGALCVTLISNHVYVEKLDSTNINILAEIGLTIFTLFLSPIFGIFNGTIQSTRQSDEISISDVQNIINAGAIWFDGIMNEFGVREMISLYFYTVYKDLVLAVRVDNSTRIDHYISNISQLIMSLLPSSNLAYLEDQSLILKLKRANEEERLIASQNNIVSGEIIALKIKPILNTNFTSQIVNPVKMNAFTIPGQVYGTPQPASYTMPAATQSSIQVLPSTNQPQQPIQIAPQVAPQTYTLSNGQQIQGNHTVQYVNSNGQPIGTQHVVGTQPVVLSQAQPQPVVMNTVPQFATSPTVAHVPQAGLGQSYMPPQVAQYTTAVPQQGYLGAIPQYVYGTTAAPPTTKLVN